MFIGVQNFCAFSLGDAGCYHTKADTFCVCKGQEVIYHPQLSKESRNSVFLLLAIDTEAS